jgi:hypothetical protein
VRIEDDGIGITEDHLARLKATLAGPPVLDAEVVRKMGAARPIDPMWTVRAPRRTGYGVSVAG